MGGVAYAVADTVISRAAARQVARITLIGRVFTTTPRWASVSRVCRVGPSDTSVSPGPILGEADRRLSYRSHEATSALALALRSVHGALDPPAS